MEIKKLYGLFLLLTIVWGCGTHNPDTCISETGVSQALAQWRKETIKDLKYNLFFNIPEEKPLPVTGKEKISFLLDKTQDVILDFRNEPDLLKQVIVNGKESDYKFENEHILIPASSLKAGANEIDIEFVAGDQSLNRNDEFLYTLLVPDRARTVFPCFDQPDLKAEFTLSLEIPENWKSISGTYPIQEEKRGEGRRLVCFAPTEPLSTYLFSFVSGKFESQSYTAGKYRLNAYYRETDPKKVAQLDVIFKLVEHSLEWQEDFTGIPYPFSKYDFVILPGFQFGGMEHAGAVLYNDMSMFLNDHPTLDEELKRSALIAHETSHMWFGDDVTMVWFDDVWTKEVFANYFAACITEPMFPGINHDLNWMRTYTAASLSEDRTPGTYSIKQNLLNLRDAGLVYGQILYNKAPVMMKKLVEIMGMENFRKGIQDYLHTYTYGNATWEQLVEILDKYSDKDLKTFSQVWVHEKGMPHLYFDVADKKMKICQKDPYHRDLIWPQIFDLHLYGRRDTVIEVEISKAVTEIDLPFEPEFVVPNSDGRGYGLMIPDSNSFVWMLLNWKNIADDTERQAVLMLLHENYLAKRVVDTEWMSSLLDGIYEEKNPLIASTIASYLSMPLSSYKGSDRRVAEQKIYQLAKLHPLTSCRLQLLRMLIKNHVSRELDDKMYDIWEKQVHEQLTEEDYMTLAYELGIRRPKEAESIIAMQRKRIKDPDRLRKFLFISRAIVSDTLRLDALFDSFLQPENRRIEPWTVATLEYLNHGLRDEYAVKYIRPALEALKDVQRTGDIFFPANWVQALLKHHQCKSAYQAVVSFFEDHPDYPVLLKNKILQAAYPLYRFYDHSMPALNCRMIL